MSEARKCQLCGSTTLVIPNRHRMMCLACSDAEIEREGITYIEVQWDGTERVCRSVDPATGLRYIVPRAWRYRR